MDTNNFIAQILVNHFIGTLAFILIGYFLSRLLKRNDIADILWGLGFLLIAVINFSLLNTPSFRAKVTLLLVMAWSLRLAFYLGIRNLSKSEEDPRYQNWRREWGSKEPINAFLRVFCLQGLLLFAISLPLGWAMNNEQRELSLIELVGVIIFSFGFIFELVADSELYFFKKLNRGKILDKGTWSLSRHPNYFGEILVWWGFFFIALPASKGLATLISPLMITFLLLKISGIPMLEKILTKKGQDFLKYQKTTPAILPFALKQIFTFALISTTLIICDAIWLGFLAGDFYQKNLTGLTRITNGKWDPNLGAALLVYFFLALSISYFAVCQSKLQSFFKGAILGMCIYGVYDFTNLALLRDWPMTIALVDVLWGTTLCGIASALGSILGPHKIGSPSSQ